MRRVLLVVGVLAVTAAVPYAALSSSAAVCCPRLAQAPTIDGLLRGGEWDRAAAVGPFVLESGGMPSLATEAYIGFDDRALYIGARLLDPMPLAVQVAAGERDGAVMADDSFTVTLDPDDDGTGIITLAVNAAGVEYDAVDGDVARTVTWPVTWQSAVHVAEDGWLVEIAWPFGEAGPPADLATWGLNLRRNAPGAAERSSMSGAGVRGTVTFGQPPLRCEVAPIAEPWYGENTVTVRLTNLAAGEQIVKVNVRVTGPTRRAHFFEVTKLTLGAGEVRDLAARYLVQRGGRCAVELSVQGIADLQARTALRTASMAFELPALGEELDEAVAQIAAAYTAFSLMPAEARPFDGASRLDMLLARWRYLDSQQQRKASLSADVVLALYTRSRTLTDDAVALKRELEEAGQ